jgi:CDP-diacylglycerol--serine O-phosphatidyltransferase
VLLDNAARAIGFAVLLDGLDGRIARMTKATSDFGVELDSIADVLTFGIAPAVLAYTWDTELLPVSSGWVGRVIFLPDLRRLAAGPIQCHGPGTAFCCQWRLPKLDKRYFVGLPIPAAAGLLAAVIHFSPRPLTAYPAEKFLLYSYLVLIAVAIWRSSWSARSGTPVFKSIGPSSNKPFVTLPLLSLLVAGIWFYSQECCW